MELRAGTSSKNGVSPVTVPERMDMRIFSRPSSVVRISRASP